MKKIAMKKTGSNLVTRPAYMAAKRGFDTTLIVLTSPITIPVSLATALAVRLMLGKPIFFKQERVGLNEEVFVLLKFRSMLDEVDAKGNSLNPSERLTQFGRLLRKSSLDELPQLLNVLRGDMALVGPRPLLVEYVPFYTDNERVRHSIRPGITGASQVRGRNKLGWDGRLSLDAEYARTGTLASDLKILLGTLGKVIRRNDTVAEPWEQGEYLSVYRSYPSNEKYALRRFEPDDIATRVRWLNDERTKRTMEVGGQITVESTHRWLKAARKNPLRKDLVVYNLESDTVVAIAGYKAVSPNALPIIYLAVDPDRQGQGIGSVTFGLLLEYMKTQPGVKGAVGEIFKENIRSIKIHQKYGFEIVEADLPEGRVRMEIKW